MPRQRAFRAKVVVINEGKLSYSEHNKKIIEEESAQITEAQDKSSPSDTSTPNVQLVKSDHTDTKTSLNLYLANEARYRKVGKDKLSLNPMAAVESFKSKIESLSNRIESIKKKARSGSRLTDMLKFPEAVRDCQLSNSMSAVKHDLKNSSQFSQMHNLIGESFGADKKVTLELYPYKRPEEDMDQERRGIEKLEITMAQIDDSKPLAQYSFIREGVTVPEALSLVKTVLSQLDDPACLKDITGKADKNIGLIESLKYAMTVDDKLSEEDKETFAKISKTWKMFEFLMENQKTVGNSMIFYSVFSSVQKQLQTFGDDINKFDTNAKTLLENTINVIKKIKESKDKINSAFIDDIQTELEAIEIKVKLTNSN
jgi:chaperonin cofactor prefoldin